MLIRGGVGGLRYESRGAAERRCVGGSRHDEQTRRLRNRPAGDLDCSTFIELLDLNHQHQGRPTARRTYTRWAPPHHYWISREAGGARPQGHLGALAVLDPPKGRTSTARFRSVGAVKAKEPAGVGSGGQPLAGIKVATYPTALELRVETWLQALDEPTANRRIATGIPPSPGQPRQPIVTRKNER